MKRPLRLTEEQYLAFEETISSDARGRAFLRLRDERSRVIAADQVRKIVRRLAAKANAPAEGQSDHIRILRNELQEMSVFIQQTRQEIAALRPTDSGKNKIVAATGELGAIVSSTERATSDILSSAEKIAAAAARVPRNEFTEPAMTEIDDQATAIMMACSFQDITGQRTTKVVNTLRYIEERVHSMIQIWGEDALKGITVPEDQDARPDAHLLNGPALEGGVSQDDIDALFGGFDAVEAPLPGDAAAASTEGQSPEGRKIDQQAIDALMA
jgi:Chemotaxis phosphatase, CheZ